MKKIDQKAPKNQKYFLETWLFESNMQLEQYALFAIKFWNYPPLDILH